MAPSFASNRSFTQNLVAFAALVLGTPHLGDAQSHIPPAGLVTSSPTAPGEELVLPPVKTRRGTLGAAESPIPVAPQDPTEFVTELLDFMDLLLKNAAPDQKERLKKIQRELLDHLRDIENSNTATQLQA